MEIAFVTKIHLPENRGVSFAIVNMCQALAKIGHKVQLFFPDRPAKWRGTSFWEYYHIERNTFPVHKLFCVNVLNIFFFEPLLIHFREIIISWSFSFSLLRYLTQKSFPVVHLFGECKEALLLLKLLRWTYRPIIFYELHITPSGWYERLLEKISVSRADVLVTSNKYLARFYRRRYQFRGKIVVAPNGVNLDEFDFRTSKAQLRKILGLPLRKTIIGFGGRFITDRMEKGIPELISALVILRKKYQNLFLVCVGGPTEYVNKYRLLASKLGVNGQDTMFLDHVAPKKLYQFMRAFDVCAMPFPFNHHFAHIMAPLKMFEYMASKNPIIATDLPSVREVLTDKETALLAKPGDPKDLARKIDFLIRNHGVGRRLARKAFALLRNHYTWEKRQKTITAAAAR